MCGRSILSARSGNVCCVCACMCIYMCVWGEGVLVPRAIYGVISNDTVYKERSVPFRILKCGTSMQFFVAYSKNPVRTT